MRFGAIANSAWGGGGHPNLMYEYLDDGHVRGVYIFYQESTSSIMTFPPFLSLFLLIPSYFIFLSKHTVSSWYFISEDTVLSWFFLCDNTLLSSISCVRVLYHLIIYVISFLHVD